MKIPGLTTVKRLNPLPLAGSLLRSINPIPLVEDKMTDLVKSLLGKFLTSSLKSFLTAVIAALALVTGAPAPDDQISFILWGAFLALIRALMSVAGKFLKQVAPDAPTAG